MYSISIKVKQKKMFVLIPVITLIVVMLCYSFRYIYDRLKLLLNTSIHIDDNQENSDNLKWVKWLPKGEKIPLSSTFFPACEGLVVEVPVTHHVSCRELLGPTCGPYSQRIRVPVGVSMYTHTGGKLQDGKEYCVSKKPPETQKCHPKWGYLKYDPSWKRWNCHSRVPGIYNATTNTFDACGPGGYLTKINSSGYRRVDYDMLDPEDVYTYPTNYKCVCPKGYISRPDISRSVCYADPCLAHLPVDVDIPGYDITTDTCNCGDYYTNMHGDPSQPCTACPDPTYDEKTGDIIMWVPCSSAYPCITPEDIERGCMKCVVKAKIIWKPKNEKDEDFLKRIVGYYSN